MSTEENKALVRRVFEAINGQSLQIVDQVMVPNYVPQAECDTERRLYRQVRLFHSGVQS